jgi:phage gp37-like protein
VSVIVEIEDLIIARLQAELDYLRTCKTYAGELEKDPQQLAMRTPAVLLALTKVVSEPLEFQAYQHEYIFDLLVVSRNLRGEDDARRANDGAYEILADVRLALIDYTLRDDLQPLALLQEEAQIISQELVLYTATYSVVMEESYG